MKYRRKSTKQVQTVWTWSEWRRIMSEGGLCRKEGCGKRSAKEEETVEEEEDSETSWMLSHIEGTKIYEEKEEENTVLTCPTDRWHGRTYRWSWRRCGRRQTRSRPPSHSVRGPPAPPSESFLYVAPFSATETHDIVDDFSLNTCRLPMIH